MTSSGRDARNAPPPKAEGSPRPRVFWAPPAVSHAQGDDAVELAASAGLVLDEWEAWALRESMGTLPGGQWAAFEVGLLVPRQNGKNCIIEARQLAGMFLLDDLLQIHTSHEFKTTEEHFLRMQALVETTPDLRRLVRKIITSHGSEGIELFPTPTIIMGSDSGSVRRGLASRRLRFLARSRSSARGFTCDCLYYDEAMILSAEAVGASMPTMSTRPNPQLWYTASEGRADAFHLARIRRRGMAGGASDLMWAEWSAELCHEMCEKTCDRHDDPGLPSTWAKANPGMGIRISQAYLSRAYASMDAATFAASHLAVSDWPADEAGWLVISEPAWDACADPGSRRPSGRGLALAVDASEGGAAAAIAVAGRRGDGKVVGEIPAGDHRPGTAWVADRLAELAARYRPAAVIVDPRGPAGHLIDEIEKNRIEVTKPSSTEMSMAFGLFVVGVKDRTFVHLGDSQLNLRAAVAGAVQRDLGDGNHAWGRKLTPVDISPLIAVTLAVWGHNKYARVTYDPLASIA